MKKRYRATGFFNRHQHFNTPVSLWGIIRAVRRLGITKELKIRREW